MGVEVEGGGPSFFLSSSTCQAMFRRGEWLQLQGGLMTALGDGPFFPAVKETEVTSPLTRTPPHWHLKPGEAIINLLCFLIPLGQQSTERGVSDSSFVNLFRESKWTQETTVEPRPGCWPGSMVT